MRILILVVALLSNVVFAASFPINNVKVEITKLEVWPSNQGTSRYSALVKNQLPGECRNNNGFAIESGPGAEAAYSTLLAATIAGKKVELYLVRCDYYVVADRVRLIP